MVDGKSNKKYLTPKEAAAYLNVSTESIRNWTKAGKLKAVTTLGGHRRFYQEDIEKFIDSCAKDVPSRGKPRVLVVDDNQQFVKTIEDYLQLKFDNIAFDKAHDGFEAGHKVNLFKPTIIFLDLVMPNINGIEVCRYIKNNKETSSIRVIAMTGFLSDTTKKEFKAAGAETVLAKPFDFDILGDIILNSSQQRVSS